MKSMFRQVLFGSYLTILIISVGLYYFTTGAVDEEETYIASLSFDHEVVTVLQDMLISLQRAESSRRGYIISGEKEYIQNYNMAVEAVQQSISYLRRVDVKRRYQSQFIDSLESVINGRIALLKSSIELSMANESSDSTQAELTGQGRDLMTSIRATVLALLVEKANSRDDTYRAIGGVRSRLRSLYAWALPLITIALCGLTISTYTHFRRRGIMEEALRRDLFQARQQVQHATTRYQDLKLEMAEKTAKDAQGSKEQE